MLAVVLCLAALALVLWQQFRHPAKADEPKSAIFPLLTYNIRIMKHKYLWDLYLDFEKECKYFGGAFAAYFAYKKTYVISEPEDCLKVLKYCPEKDNYGYDLFKPWLGESSALLVSGQNCKAGRKRVALAMSQKNHDSFLEEFNWHSHKLVTKMLARHVDKEPFDVTRWLADYTLQVMLVNIFGFDRTENINWDDYLEANKVFMELMAVRLKNPLLKVDAIFNLTAHAKKLHAAVKSLEEPTTTTEILNKYRNAVENNLKQPGNNFINIIMQSQGTGAMTEKELREDVKSVIFGAHDTTVSTLLYTLLLLGSNQDVQDKVYQELQNVIGETVDRDITSDDLRDLVYLEAVLKESIRLYPFTPVLPRVIDCDLKLKKTTLYSNTMCMVMVWTAHRHESWGAAPDHFRPERWLHGAPLPPLLGFSEGPRICLGKAFAMMSMKTLLAKLLLQCKVFADIQQLQINYTGLLEPKAGHFISLAKR